MDYHSGTLAIFICICIGSVAPLTCYSCDSASDSTCVNGLTFIPTADNCTYCLKYYYMYQGVITVERSCSSTLTSGYLEDVCHDQSRGEYTTIRCACDNQDVCNLAISDRTTYSLVSMMMLPWLLIYSFVDGYTYSLT